MQAYLPERDKRSKLAQTRVKPREYKAFRKAARDAGVSLSDWLRSVALAALEEK